MAGSHACASALVGMLLLSSVPVSADVLEVVNEWTTLTFDFPHDFPVHEYVPVNTVITGVTVADHRIFVAMPRLRAGVPATLGWILRNGPVQQPIRAFPHWGWHNPAANCSGIISVYRTRIDHCNRLWVLDSGVTTSLDDFTTVCPPKLLVFDLSNDRLLRSITFPKEVLRNESLLTNLVIDDLGNGIGYPKYCDDVFVYMSDTAEPGLVVYNSAEDTIWRITHPAMEPDPGHSTFNIVGDSFMLMDGLIGLALSPPSHHRQLYFQPLATDRLFSVPTAALRSGPPHIGQRVPVTLVGYKSSQAAGLATDHQGQIYFSPVTETAVVLWDPHTENSKVIAYDRELLQFVPDISFPRGRDDVIYMVSTRFQKFFLRTWDPQEINLRILRIRPGLNIPRGLFNNRLPYF